MTRKKNLLVLLAFVMTFLLMTVAVNAREMEDTAFSLYNNARFNYQIVYPDIFDIKRPSDNNDGQTFELSGMSTHSVLKVWGAHNIDKKNGFALLGDAKNRLAHIVFDEAGPDHYKIIYSDDGGRDGNETVFYEYGIASEKTIAVFIFSFPYDLKDYYIPLIDRTRITLNETPSWLTLVDAIAYSQSLHLDSFKSSSAPDAVTINQTLYYLVQKGYFYDKYPGKNMSDNKYYFSYGPENSEINDFDKSKYTSPDKLYDSYFAKGSYKYPERGFAQVAGTQTGIMVSLQQPVNKIKTKILKEHNKNGLKTIDADIAVFDTSLKKARHIGQARIVLQKDDASYFGYTVLSFEPKYKSL